MFKEALLVLNGMVQNM